MFGNLGRALRLLREQKGLSQARLARSAGIGKSQLSKYENGRELPRLDSLEKVLNALEADYLGLFHAMAWLDKHGSALVSRELGLVEIQMPVLSVLHPVAEEAFSKAFHSLLVLHGKVIEEFFVGRLKN
jgi:transcriptional regulator with XRE-family HTH domain